MAIAKIKETFEDFIRRVSRKKGRRLDSEELATFSRQITILKSLLEGEGFPEKKTKTLNEVRRNVLSRGSIVDEDINKLNEILGIL